MPRYLIPSVLKPQDFWAPSFPIHVFQICEYTLNEGGYSNLECFCLKQQYLPLEDKTEIPLDPLLQRLLV